MKQLLKQWLRGIARNIIVKHQPYIIGITGNVGKTTTREVLHHYVRNTDTRVRAPIKNYNNEWGVPFTIIGKHAQGKNPLAWLAVLAEGLRLQWFASAYPSVLILEIGIDAPGDMDRFTEDFLYLDVLILTNIGTHPVHKEFFASVEELTKEKLKLVSALKADGTLIYNADEPKFRSLRNKAGKFGTVLTFGCEESADFQAKHISQSVRIEEQRFAEFGSALVPSLTFTVAHRGAGVPVDVPYMFADTQVYAVLPTIVYAVSHGTNLVSVSDRLTYTPTPGRLRFLEGRNGSLLIDDTYNAAPQAMHQALHVFSRLDTLEARCVAILGDMKELGEDTETIHTDLAPLLTESVDLFVGVGSEMQKVSAQVESEPLLETVAFEDSREAADWMTEHIGEEDIVLVKGAQSMRMERVVRAVMAYPEYASQVLPRQGTGWD